MPIAIESPGVFEEEEAAAAVCVGVGSGVRLDDVDDDDGEVMSVAVGVAVSVSDVDGRGSVSDNVYLKQFWIVSTRHVDPAQKHTQGGRLLQRFVQHQRT